MKAVSLALVPRGLQIDNAQVSVRKYKDFIRSTVEDDVLWVCTFELAPVAREICSGFTIAEGGELLRQLPIFLEIVANDRLLRLLQIGEDGCAEVVEWRVKSEMK